MPILARPKTISSDFTLGAQLHRDGSEHDRRSSVSRSSRTTRTSSRDLPASTAVTRAVALTTQKSFGMIFQEDLGFSKEAFHASRRQDRQELILRRRGPSFVLPKIGVSYVLSEEPFWNLFANVVSTMRLRLAWGSTGRSPPPGASIQTYSAAAYAVGSSVNPGVSLNNPGNSNLKAELGQEFEGGFDATFFHDRASLEVTYFDKTSDNLLLQDPLPPSEGYATNPYVRRGEGEQSRL